MQSKIINFKTILKLPGAFAILGLLLLFLGILTRFLSVVLGDGLSTVGSRLLFLALIGDLFLTPARIKVAEKNQKRPREPIFFWLLLLLGAGWMLSFSFSGVGYLGKQCYNFVKNGTWQPNSVIDILLSNNSIGLFDIPENITTWAVAPENWIGIHKIFQFLNGGFTFMIFGLVICCIACAPVIFWDKKYGPEIN